MIGHVWSVLPLVLLLGGTGIAADDGDRDKLLGSWVEADNGASAGWTFAKDGDSLRITERQGTAAVANYLCNTDGRDCEIKTSGKKANVSMWFNGPKLVQMETQGSIVVKRRFAVVAPGDEMELEIMPMVAKGKTETIRFKRMPSPAH